MSKFCQQCGSQMPDDANTCTNCGYNFSPNSYNGNTFSQAHTVPQGNSAVVKPKKKHGCLIGIGVFTIFLFIFGAIGSSNHDTPSTSNPSKNKTEKTSGKSASVTKDNTDVEDSSEIDTLEQIQENIDTLKDIKEDFDTIMDIKEDIDELTGKDKKKEEKKKAKKADYIKVTVNEICQELNDNSLRAETKYNDAYLELTGNLSVIDSDGKYFSLQEMDKLFGSSVTCYYTEESQKDILMEHNKGDTMTIKCQVTSIGEILGYSVDVIEIE